MIQTALGIEQKINFSISLSPTGHLNIEANEATQETLAKSLAMKIEKLWQGGYARGLLHLGLLSLPTSETVSSPSVNFWQRFASKFVTHVCRHASASDIEKLAHIDFNAELAEFLADAPFMLGGEYLNLDVLKNNWLDLHAALTKELEGFRGSLQDYLLQFNSNWNLVGRVCFHLAENKDNAAMPFAFLATYTTRLSGDSKVQHVPLGKALQEYAGAKNQTLLLALLSPVQKAMQESAFIKELVDSGRIFQPVSWRAQEAHKFLKDINLFENSGIVVRVPNWWNPKKPSRPQVAIEIGKNKASSVGADALLDFNVNLALPDGQKLTRDEWQELLHASENLVKIKGQWVEIDREKLEDVLAHWRSVQNAVKTGGLTFSAGMRLLAGMGKDVVADDKDAAVRDWSAVFAGNWLREVLQNLRSPDAAKTREITAIIKQTLKANLRPYQLIGVQWLWLLYNLKLGGCLADDMGLGKTIQVLSLLLLRQREKTQKLPNLIVVPASLLGNWQNELTHFAPSLKFFVAHSSAETDLQNITVAALADYDVVFTTYALLLRLALIADAKWDMVILDEAQLIKNPGAKQTRAVKALNCNVRFILTGTPIENSLGDLWSLFDFLAPGLLGAQKTFARYAKKMMQSNQDENQAQIQTGNKFFSALRSLVSPYILRRLKSDKNIISDLPDKTEVNNYCSLTKQQVVLYQQTVACLAKQLKNDVDGIKRRGIVLSSIMRLKQICNHPCQFLGYGDYAEKDSGKFLQLRKLCETIHSKQEKVLIFTQFREIIPAMVSHLTGIFQREGIFLHGNVKVGERQKLVSAFQEEHGPPFFVLSLKAGGTGLNLTSASHVIHFDRWWNPAVENQATDRAYRIGQKKNVLVHKFICQGTIEEKIDQLINDKKALAKEVLSGGNEIMLTELSNDELLQIVSLDIGRVFGGE